MPAELTEGHKPENMSRLEAMMADCLKRTAVDGEVLDSVDGEVASALCGMAVGLLVKVYQLQGMTPETARGAAVGWIVGRAGITSSAVREAAGAPSPQVAEAEAAAYSLAVMDGTVPPSCPAWMPRVLAVMVRSALISGYMHADGLERDAAVSATRAKLAAMAEGSS
jgi:hypothetical protein